MSFTEREIEVAFKKSEFKTYKELSEASGVSYATVCNFFKVGGSRDSTLEALAEALGLFGDNIAAKLEQAEQLGGEYVVEETPYTYQVVIYTKGDRIVYSTTMKNEAGLKKANEIAKEKNDGLI
jgi:hypothetical protein